MADTVEETPPAGEEPPPSAGSSKLGTALFAGVVVALVVVVAAQMYYIFGMQVGAPKTPRPSRVATAPSGRPLPGESGLPSGAPGVTALDTKTVRPGMLFGGIVAMQRNPDTALTSEQVQKVRPIVEAIQADATRGSVTQQLRVTLVGVLRKEQLEVVMQAQQGTAVAADPLSSGLAILKKIAGDAKPMTSSAGARDRRSAQIWPWKVGIAVKQMQKDPKLALSAPQAAALVPLMEKAIESRDFFISKVGDILAVLTPAQRDIVMQSSSVDGGNANPGDALAALKGKK